MSQADNPDTTTPSRRKFMRLVSVPAAGYALAKTVAQQAVAASVDPIPSLRTEYLGLRGLLDNHALDDDGWERAYARVEEIEHLVTRVRATTVGGAIASLEWAAEENMKSRADGILGGDVVGSLIQGALGVLRVQSA